MSEYFGKGGYSSVWRDGWRKARKSHECDACEVPIAPGHRYHYTFSVFQNDPYATTRCSRCQALYAHLSARMDQDEACHPTLHCGHDYEERWREPPPPEIAELAFWLPKDGPPRIAE